MDSFFNDSTASPKAVSASAMSPELSNPRFHDPEPMKETGNPNDKEGFSLFCSFCRALSEALFMACAKTTVAASLSRRSRSRPESRRSAFIDLVASKRSRTLKYDTSSTRRPAYSEFILYTICLEGAPHLDRIIDDDIPVSITFEDDEQVNQVAFL